MAETVVLFLPIELPVLEAMGRRHLVDVMY